MMRRLAMLVLVISGCKPPCPDGKCVLQASGDADGPLVECIAGAWQAAGSGGSCSPVPCLPDGGGAAECSRQDCLQFSYIVFDAASHSGAIGSFITSSSNGTWSSVIPPERFGWYVDGGALFVDTGASSRPQSASCTKQQLVLDEIALKMRMSDLRADALRAFAFDGGTWAGLPMP